MAAAVFIMTLSLFSPAKINLFLRVLKKRPDGYHELATLIQAIDFGDTLTFKLSSQDHFTCSDPTLPANGSNLVIKAIELFRRKTGLHFGVSIHLEKKIPIQAGLGGGSGNAATTLWGMNLLSGSSISESELQKWSSEIGSDIPFFFSSGTAYCTGRGEHVRSLPLILLGECLLMKPSYGLSTPQVFQHFDLKEASIKDPEEMLEKLHFYNDLERPAMKMLPELREYREKLHQNNETAIMTGSGTAFFCLNPIKPMEGSREIRSIKRLEGSWY